MDEKTAELRDIFMDVASDETVTERQEEAPGGLADDRGSAERMRELISTMRERYAFETDLSHETMVRIARGFYGDATDADLANDLDMSPETVTRARFDLHLVQPADLEDPLPQAEVRQAVADEIPVTTLLEETDGDDTAIRRQYRAAQTAARMRQASHRFRDEFDELLGDADVADHMPDDVAEDGLREATEDMEIETGF